MTVTLGGSASASTTTSAAGAYAFAGLADGTYTVTPTSASFTFSPPSATVPLAGADATGRNFAPTPTGGGGGGTGSSTISGQILGTGPADVWIVAQHQAGGGSAVLHWDGTSVRSVRRDGYDLATVWAAAPGVAYVAGNGGALLTGP